MSVSRVPPDEAAELLQQGWKYVDVRSIPEFSESHPAGAYNIPIMHRGPTGQRPNRDFLAVVERTFARDDKLVIGCRTGRRSLRAAEQLVGAGYANVVDMMGGLVGETDATGQMVCEGWASRGLPVSSEPEPGRSYEELEG